MKQLRLFSKVLLLTLTVLVFGCIEDDNNVHPDDFKHAHTHAMKTVSVKDIPEIMEFAIEGENLTQHDPKGLPCD